MLDIKINLLKNRLYITYSPYPEDPRGNGIHAIEEAAKKLTPGFTCITRVTDIRNINPGVLRFARKARRVLENQGMARAVRTGELPKEKTAEKIAGDDATGSRFRTSRCPVLTAETPEKAEMLLDHWEHSEKEEDRREYLFAGNVMP